MRSEKSPRESGKSSIFDAVSLARISPPIAVPHFVYRQELVNRINQPAPHATFIVAPSGYGKSALAVQAISRLDIPVVWYSISTNDSTRDTAINVIAAVRRVIRNFAPWAEEYLESDFDVVDWTVRLCNELERVKSEIVIVWDGADNFSDDHLGMTQAFIDNSPNNVRFISIRRVMPGVSYARLASFDALTFISASDLKFNDDEIRVIAEQHGINYLDPNFSYPFIAVQGWPAGIQLLAKEIAQTHSGKSPIFIDGKTMVKSAVDHLKCKDRNFLEAMVFLDEFSGLDAIELTSESDAINHLEHMSVEGIFVTRFDGDIPMYQINTLIRAELQERVAENKEVWTNRAIRSAELSIRNGNELHAVDLYSLIGMEAEAKALAVRNIQTMMIQGKVQLLRKWAPRLGDTFGVGDFGSNILLMCAELSMGNFEKAQVVLSEIERDPDLAKFEKNNNREIGLAKATIAFSHGRFDEVVQLLRESTTPGISEEIPQISKKISGLRTALMSTFIMYDLEKFNEIFAAISLSDSDDAYTQKLTLPAIRAMEAFLAGRYNEAYESALFALHSSEAFEVRGIFIPFEAAYILADVSLEFGDEEKSLEIIENYLPLAIQAEQWPWVVGLLAKAALVKVQQGRVNEGLNFIRQAREYVAGPRFGKDIAYLADWHEIFARIALNDFERIQELAFRLPNNSLTRYLLLMFEARKNPGEAARLASSIPEDSEHQKFGKALFLAEATFSNPPVATRHLREALEIAAAHGYFRSFLNLSQECKSLLLDIAGKNPTVYMEQIAQGIRKQSNAVQHDGIGSDHALTKRELDILRRLATGLPITQIAATLHISNNTIKTHLKNVYRKMSVGSREEAVARGHELLLL